MQLFFLYYSLEFNDIILLGDLYGKTTKVNSTIWILEFSEGALRNLLEDKDEYTRVIDADVDEHTIYLERTGFCVTQQKYVRYRAKYIWNSQSSMYEEKIIKIIDSYKPGIGGSA